MNEERPKPPEIEQRAEQMLNQTTSLGWNWGLVPREWREFYRAEAQREHNYRHGPL